MQSRLCPLLIRDPQGLSCAPEVSLLSCTPPGQPCHGAASLRVPPRVWPGRWAALTSPCSPLELIATCTRIEWVPLVRIARVVTQPRHGMQEGSCSGADRPLVAAQTLARLSRSTVTGAGATGSAAEAATTPLPANTVSGSGQSFGTRLTDSIGRQTAMGDHGLSAASPTVLPHSTCCLQSS